MNIALDFDDTYTADPPLWDAFISQAHLAGHRVYCVTCRRDTPENRDDVRIEMLPKYRHLLTNMSPKRWFCERHGIAIDIWIDDWPECVKDGR